MQWLQTRLHMLKRTHLRRKVIRLALWRARKTRCTHLQPSQNQKKLLSFLLELLFPLENVYWYSNLLPVIWLNLYFKSWKYCIFNYMIVYHVILQRKFKSLNINLDWNIKSEFYSYNINHFVEYSLIITISWIWRRFNGPLMLFYVKYDKHP